jgi:hypothetical protein
VTWKFLTPALIRKIVIGIIVAVVGALAGELAKRFFAEYFQPAPNQEPQLRRPQPPPASPGPNTEPTVQKPPPIILPALNLAGVARPRMFWGTLPPNGGPAVVYSVTNTSTEGLKNVEVSVWIMEGSNARKLDERQLGYIGQGEFREGKALLSFTPFGRGLLCLSFSYENRNFDVLHFYQSLGEYAKYGPMKEMQKFKDPIVGSQSNGLCQSVGARAAVLINQ